MPSSEAAFAATLLTGLCFSPMLRSQGATDADPPIAFVRVPAGSFLMGSSAGDFDEAPPHRVTISRPFWMSVTEITNAQFERFDPDHRARRGERGFAADDDEPVVFVTWQQAVAFCAWLGQRDGKRYRLPTEAEWEYACRAGTTTAFSTGDTLPQAWQRNQRADWNPQPVALHVGRTEANAFGLRGMHGNVEEWCYDWYAPYRGAPAVDPSGPADGLFKVTRGGSHGTPVAYLRSANRLGTLPDDAHELIGFRIVEAPPPAGAPQPQPSPPRWARDVAAEPFDWASQARRDAPLFAPPLRFVQIEAGADGPLFATHNHCPDIVWCANGDLFATWYTTRTEAGRELTVAAARLRRGAEAWDPADVFCKAPDRNMHATALWSDDGSTLYHFNGLGIAQGWGMLALFFRTSTDNGASWSAPRWIDREHGLRHMPVAGVTRTRDGALLLPCDAVTGGNGGTALWIGTGDGAEWRDAGGTIAGIHAGVVELRDGRWLGLGRGDTIDGRMPQSVSADRGATWQRTASPFPPIGSGQRLALLRLREGPILLLSFTDDEARAGDGPRTGLEFADRDGGTFRGFGLFAALSFDDGRSWPVRKLLAPAPGVYDGGAWTRRFTADATHAEPRGYLAATQSPDGVIQLLSSGLHYRFDLAWLRQPPAPPGR